jgi:hypothetical protein
LQQYGANSSQFPLPPRRKKANRRRLKRAKCWAAKAGRLANASGRQYL